MESQAKTAHIPDKRQCSPSKKKSKGTIFFTNVIRSRSEALFAANSTNRNQHDVMAVLNKKLPNGS
jgi:hypothetical protein